MGNVNADSSLRGFRYWRETAAAALLVLVTWAVFAQTLTFDFVNYDDPVYVTENFELQGDLDLVSVYEVFTLVGRSGHWHPLTWISLMIDFQLFRLEPWGYHLHNLVLHTGSTLLLFVILRWTTGAVVPSALVAGLFAVHPLHVESVAWISERKDALSAFFWMLTTLAYVAYAREPTASRYRLMVLCYVLGLLSKPMLVTLPATLLLLDYWPLGRFRFAPASVRRWPPVSTWRLVAEKLPLFALAGGSCAMTVWGMHKSHAIRPLTQFTFVDRLGNSVIGYVTYLRKAVWPSDLAPYYPMQTWQDAELYACLAVLVVLCLAVAVLARRHPAVLVGWLWYLGTLVPVIGVVQVGSQAYADRFSYIPLVGVFIGGVWLAFDSAPTARGRLIVAVVLIALTSALGVVAFSQAGIWHDSVSLWTHNLAVTEDNYLAETNLASAYLRDGKPDLAVPHLERAVVLRPDDREAYRKLGLMLKRAERTDEAIGVAERAAQRWPKDPSLAHWLADLLQQAGRLDEGREWQRRADALDDLQGP
jgi:hypothetical protein